jgi:hypothetical protein
MVAVSRQSSGHGQHSGDIGVVVLDVHRHGHTEGVVRKAYQDRRGRSSAMQGEVLSIRGGSDTRHRWVATRHVQDGDLLVVILKNDGQRDRVCVGQ